MDRITAIGIVTSPRVKPTVEYSAALFVEVGLCALVSPKNHPSIFVSNTKIVRTSPVIRANSETGLIETDNTKYVPGPRVRSPYFTLN